MIVVGIENLYNRLCQVFLLYSLLVVALVKGIQAEGIDRFRIPDSQRIHHIVAVANDRHIIRHGTDGLVSLLNEMLSAVIPDRSDVTAELHLRSILRTADLKRITVL